MQDISSAVRTYETSIEDIQNVPVQFRKTATNGVTYFKMITNMSTLPSELKIYLPLFCDVISSLPEVRLLVE
jgi:Zn-dependent M16 (insulinase) family peptidase